MPDPRTAPPAYGIDAPGVLFGLLGSGLGLLLAGLSLRLVWPSGTAAGLVALAVMLIGLVPGLLGLSFAAYVRWGKLRVRDRMIDSVPWTGDEHVLDIGTGAGLLMIGAALRLTTGRALGIDLWSAKDLSNNASAVPERNAVLAGVAHRVSVLTGDARRLPLPDASVDRVLSLLCLHNIESAAERDEACREIVRVLRPGGVALIGDVMPAHRYATVLAASGLDVRSSQAWFRTALSPMWVVDARKPLSDGDRPTTKR